MTRHQLAVSQPVEGDGRLLQLSVGRAGTHADDTYGDTLHVVGLVVTRTDD